MKVTWLVLALVMSVGAAQVEVLNEDFEGCSHSAQGPEEWECKGSWTKVSGLSLGNPEVQRLTINSESSNAFLVGGSAKYRFYLPAGEYLRFYMNYKVAVSPGSNPPSNFRCKFKFNGGTQFIGPVQGDTGCELDGEGIVCDSAQSITGFQGGGLRTIGDGESYVELATDQHSSSTEQHFCVFDDILITTDAYSTLSPTPMPSGMPSAKPVATPTNSPAKDPTYVPTVPATLTKSEANGFHTEPIVRVAALMLVTCMIA